MRNIDLPLVIVLFVEGLDNSIDSRDDIPDMGIRWHFIIWILVISLSNNRFINPGYTWCYLNRRRFLFLFFCSRKRVEAFCIFGDDSVKAGKDKTIGWKDIFRVSCFINTWFFNCEMSCVLILRGFQERRNLIEFVFPVYPFWQGKEIQWIVRKVERGGFFKTWDFFWL